MSLSKLNLKQLKNQIVCPICGTPLLGVIETDAWGNRYCSRHSKEYFRCSCCQRLICDQLTNGGVAYKDNRLVCNFCRKSAIDTKEQAKPLVEQVAAWLLVKGINLENLRFNFDLVYLNQISPVSQHGHGMPQGIIYQSPSVLSSGRKVRRIEILKGLSRQVMSGVVAHELGHAWLFMNRIDNLPSPIVEGFCNTLSYLYHDDFKTDEAEFCKMIIAKNPDEIYGNGFRLVYSSLKKNGLAKLLSHLKKYHALP